MGNRLPGSRSTPVLLLRLPADGKLSVPRAWTDLGKEQQRLPKRPPATALEWDTARKLPSSLFSSKAIVRVHTDITAGSGDRAGDKCLLALTAD